jgi:cytochrome c oxidase subunit I+III
VYTYPSGMGWATLNLLSTIGSYVLALGILIVVANVVWSLRWGAAAGSDPWGADTLEWATTSPPPNYNFATIPVVRSANPNWDRADREEDEGRLARGELVLPLGHETVATSEVEADLDGVLHMPGDSVWPLILAASLSVFFVGLIASSNAIAWAGVAMIVVSLAGWQLPWSSEEEQAPSTRPTAWWGIVLLIATEATLFTVLIATYFYLRFKTGDAWPPAGIGDPKIVKPLITTLILVGSSMPVAFSTRALRDRRLARARLGLSTAAMLGIVFLILQRQLVDDSLQTFRPGDNAYGSIFYTLIGLHAAHVVLGVLLGAWAILRTTRFDRTAVVTVRVTALYFHFVNVVAALVFVVLYLSPRG